MSWKEAETILAARPVVVLPLGARLKEHGLHLPLNNDWIMAEYLAARVVAAADVVLLPTIQHGHYPAFSEYPGSVNVGLETSRDVVLDVCRSIARHGPKKFYVLNTGVSTVHALAPAQETLRREGIALAYTDILAVAGAAEKQVAPNREGTHADEVETSMMLYIDPSIVRMELAQRDFHESKGPGGLTRDPRATTGAYSPTGAWGDPTKATPEKGRVVVEAMVAGILADIERLRSAESR